MIFAAFALTDLTTKTCGACASAIALAYAGGGRGNFAVSKIKVIPLGRPVNNRNMKFPTFAKALDVVRYAKATL